jgi:hypothetical protein
VVDERGRLYTVGGTSGINYFMDVFSLDLTRFLDRKPVPVYEKQEYLHVYCIGVQCFGSGSGLDRQAKIVHPSCGRKKRKKCHVFCWAEP